MKKSYSRVLVYSLAILSFVLGVAVVMMLFIPSPNPVTPDCNVDRVHNVPPAGPITINGKRPFVLTLVNKNQQSVIVNVTIIGTSTRKVQPVQLQPATLNSTGSTLGSYKSVVVDIDLGEVYTGTNFNYKIDLTDGNSTLTNVYAIYSDDTEFVR